ncbi:GntR family transcriptional regulator [Desulfotomaculum copahuensis]|uniref:GntR family transcriptional regulator n=1 Tax=Desulfotomaculum copahuensis TaxID=1838280 RepID=UPI000A8236D6|nr:GntR family transcriptional regulator [Desulfotomaculum copahuensis]
MQLKEQIRYAVATGRLKPGDRLPTVRQLAVELRINPNTVSRVYSELEKEGLLATRQGKGTFVRSTANDTPSLDVLAKLVDRLLVEAAGLGFTVRDVMMLLERKLKEAGQDGR